MADVRALLKAKRQEARISHPYAAYTTAGQLKCTVCSTPVKHASAWEGHLGSKAHRVNVVRMREEEAQQRALAAQKEAAVEQDDSEDEEDGSDEEAEPRMAPGKRRAAEDDEDAGPPTEKKRKVEGAAPGGFPQDFFSDPSRGPILLPEDDEDDDGEGDANRPAGASTSRTTVAAAAAPGAPKNEVDLEYERFQRELLATAEAASSSDKQEAFQRATVFAEPVAASTEIAGFPPTSTTAATEPAPQEVTEEEARQKKEQEERELIMDRLLEEERAQEDADTKVQMLKNRVEALRKKREQAKAKKTKVSS